MSKEANLSRKSTIFKDAMILFVITLIAGLALGFVHEITLPVIEAQNLQAKINAYRTVFPEAAEFVEDEPLSLLIQEATGVLEPKGYTNVTIDEALTATDESGNKLGYVVVVTTQEGYGGAITLSLGYGTDGTVKGMEILTMNETAGLGAKASGTDFKSQFADKKVNEFTYTKTGAANDNEIDALNGATITTKAVVNAVNSGICFITELVETEGNEGGKQDESK